MIKRQDQLQVAQSKMYEIRGQKVMFDFDLAEMYGTKTKRLKEAVRRNTKRFPCDFMFELTKEGYAPLRTQSAASKSWGETRYMSFAFTEHGVTQFSSVLNSGIAIEINMQITRAFTAVRQVTVNPPTDKFTELQREVKELKVYIEEVFTNYNGINDDTRMQLELINQTLAELQTQEKLSDKPHNPIGFVKP